MNYSYQQIAFESTSVFLFDGVTIKIVPYLETKNYSISKFYWAGCYSGQYDKSVIHGPVFIL